MSELLQCFGGPMDGSLIGSHDLLPDGTLRKGICRTFYKPPGWPESYWAWDWNGTSLDPDAEVVYELNDNRLSFREMTLCNSL